MNLENGLVQMDRNQEWKGDKKWWEENNKNIFLTCTEFSDNKSNQ